MALATSQSKAHFVTVPAGGALGNQSLNVQTGATIEIGLSAAQSAIPGVPSGIIVTTDGGAGFTGRVNIAPTWRAGATIYRVTGFRGGPVRLLACLGATVLDSVKLQVTGQELASMTVLDALDSKFLNVSPDQAKVLRDSIAGSKTVIVDDDIIELLAALLRQGSVDVLSLLRRGESQHGVVEGGKVTCKAVDVMGFAGTPVISNDPAARLIDVVCRVLAALPDIDLDIGFPRPVGGPTGFDPTHDVFFDVPDEATAKQCFDGTISRTLSQMRQPAQDRVADAMKRSRARFHVLFPDGLNHLHLNLTKFPGTLVSLP
ncbi:MAG TPA: hypothetical protein VHW24_17650 [Bryobacteraceae bacterium]|jgi:hypothetical protein|nr:hypothetical protein [Bryobacteraceae bacterium]